MRTVGGRHFCLLLLAAGLAACACGHSPGADQTQVSAGLRDEIKVRVANVGFDEGSGAHYVLLQDESDAHELPIMVGPGEAQAIALALHGVKAERPLTHDLLESIIVQTGNRVDRVVIAEMRNEVYYATIFLDGGRYRIDSRPSDAIAIAMGAGVPIYVNDRLFAAEPAGLAATGRLPDTARGLGITVEQLTPELAQYFGVSGQHGVLVSAAGADAARAGLERGDVITRVAGSEVAAPEDFVRQVSAAKNPHGVAITVRRGAAEQAITIPAASAASVGR